jgi:hypothetical protein
MFHCRLTIYSGFSHEKWWFSIAMLVYQRVNHPFFWLSPHYFKTSDLAWTISNSLLLALRIWSKKINRTALPRSRNVERSMYSIDMYRLYSNPQKNDRKGWIYYYFLSDVTVLFVWFFSGKAILKSKPDKVWYGILKLYWHIYIYYYIWPIEVAFCLLSVALFWGDRFPKHVSNIHGSKLSGTVYRLSN